MPKAKINGNIMHYHVDGSGTPIVFIHPPLVNRAVFRYQEVQLADTFQVITFDIRGHGFSPGSETPVTYPLIAEDIKSLLDYLEIREAYLCGYSTGGGVALEALLNYPDRFRGAMLLSGMAKPIHWMVKGQLAAAGAMARWAMKTSLALLVAKANADMPETFHNLYYEAIRGNPDNWRQYFEASRKVDYTQRLNRIHVPVLLVYGAKDRRFIQHGKELHRLLPNSTLALIPGVKHYIPTCGADLFHELAEKWIITQELRRASEGKELADQQLFRRAAELDLSLPAEIEVD